MDDDRCNHQIECGEHAMDAGIKTRKGQERRTRRLEWCPGCGSASVRAVMAGDKANFLCRECGCCWHLDTDCFRVVDPRACSGCSSRPVCIRRLWEPLQRVGVSDCDRGDAPRHDRWS